MCGLCYILTHILILTYLWPFQDSKNSNGLQKEPSTSATSDDALKDINSRNSESPLKVSDISYTISEDTNTQAHSSEPKDTSESSTQLGHNTANNDNLQSLNQAKSSKTDDDSINDSKPPTIDANDESINVTNPQTPQQLSTHLQETSSLQIVGVKDEITVDPNTQGLLRITESSIDDDITNDTKEEITDQSSIHPDDKTSEDVQVRSMK